MRVALETRPWTLDEVHRLPDDGNKYELVRGELFVTPPPNEEHEDILARLTRMLDPFVAAYGMGMIYHPRAVMRFEGSEVEPDLMVRQPSSRMRDRDWDAAPIPRLVVEVLSGTTRRRDLVQKRRLYEEAGVEEYWIIDPEDASIRRVRAERQDQVAKESFIWAPDDVPASVRIDVRALFGSPSRG